MPDSERPVLPHSCISKRFYYDLPRDSAVLNTELALPPEYELCDSCVVDLRGPEAGDRDGGEAVFGDPVSANLDTLSLRDHLQQSASSGEVAHVAGAVLSAHISSSSLGQVLILLRDAAIKESMLITIPFLGRC